MLFTFDSQDYSTGQYHAAISSTVDQASWLMSSLGRLLDRSSSPATRDMQTRPRRSLPRSVDSLVSNGGERVDCSCPASRYTTGKHRDDTEYYNDGEDDEGIAGPDAEQQARHQSSQEQGSCNANTCADYQHPAAVTHDHQHY